MKSHNTDRNNIGGIIQTPTLSRFWHRRICEVAALFSLTVIALGIWLIVDPASSPPLFRVDIVTVSSAVVTLALAVIFYIYAPKESGFARAYTVYLAFSATTAVIVSTSGGVLSPFIPFAVAVALFAAIYGIWGVIVGLVQLGLLTALAYLSVGLSADNLTMLALFSALPLIAGVIAWHTHDKEVDTKARYDIKSLTNELSEVATKSEVVINAIGDGVVAIDSTGIIQLINPAAQATLGWGKQDALSLNYRSILQLRDEQDRELDSITDPIQQVLNNNQQTRANDLVMLTQTGKKIDASLVVSPIGDAGSGVIVVFRDITKEKSEEREQAEFISTASHEMRTPVASIEGYLGLALNPQTSAVDARARDYIVKAQESAQHLGRLFQDLLDVSKAEDGRLSNNPKVINLTEYVHDIVLGLQEKAKAKNLKLTYKPMPDDDSRRLAPVYYVNLDSDHIREVVNNLVENAVKYTLQGDVVVDLSGADERVTISVKDSGIGIPVEDIPHLFQKFYRVDNVDTRQIGGTGLGLYLSRRLVEAVGGRLWVQSEYKQGSTFFVELPRIDAKEAEFLKSQQSQTIAPNSTPIAVQPTISQPSGLNGTMVQPVIPTPAPPISPLPVIPPLAAPAPVSKPPQVRAATNVPRGQALSREEIAAYAAKLNAMAARETQVQPNGENQADKPADESSH